MTTVTIFGVKLQEVLSGLEKVGHVHFCGFSQSLIIHSLLHYYFVFPLGVSFLITLWYRIVIIIHLPKQNVAGKHNELQTVLCDRSKPSLGLCYIHLSTMEATSRTHSGWLTFSTPTLCDIWWSWDLVSWERWAFFFGCTFNLVALST